MFGLITFSVLVINGSFPHIRDQKTIAIKKHEKYFEERNVFFVALSRCKVGVYLLIPQNIQDADTFKTYIQYAVSSPKESCFLESFSQFINCISVSGRNKIDTIKNNAHNMLIG